MKNSKFINEWLVKHNETIEPDFVERLKTFATEYKKKPQKSK